MSNPMVATLCEAGSWQCEGIRIKSEDKGSPLSSWWHGVPAGDYDFVLGGLDHSNTQQQYGLGTGSSSGFSEASARMFYRSFKDMNELLRYNLDEPAIKRGAQGITVALANEFNQSNVIETLKKTPFADGLPGPVRLRPNVAKAIFENNLKVWQAAVWPRSKPVLLEKTPIYFKFLEQLHDIVTAFSQRGFPPLRPAYIVMWRPACLSVLSSHFSKLKAHMQELVLKNDIALAARAIAAFNWSRRIGAPMLVLSYADILWRTEYTTERLRAFLPCIASSGFNMSWVPQLGKDIFEDNKWKVKGSIAEFGKRHRPESFGYDLTKGTCDMATFGKLQGRGTTWERTFNRKAWRARLDNYTRNELRLRRTSEG